MPINISKLKLTPFVSEIFPKCLAHTRTNTLPIDHYAIYNLYEQIKIEKTSEIVIYFIKLIKLTEK